ncbi:pyridoxal phosphate enzyme (YggS family) [Rhizobium sp. SG_E_25_P2]|jgi:PLP dependent protein|uniref:YggS family pyridoxal phosphate-dependent enzyme n=1 Tax=Rhizobium sp. SG_E_25_P2 TaxID=2879942 RepID=UPI002474413C|nr:YggS family pyridoxal phosphate-dependent enzyme [Rhizobium sp. SG_E_25_P2]MDH6269353.1 pyridoxal phosphate enzyme (YggS family) [Rhizobium sp. SG_E_25_P2]
MSTVDRYHEILARIAKAADEAGKAAPQLVAVTKTFSGEEVRPVIEAGHRVFGENRVQEAEAKWPALRAEFPDIELRLIGPLQSNKAEDAVALFDVIETVDREKIARALKTEMDKQGRSPRLYVQINTGLEPQKAGVAPDDAPAFLSLCRNDLGLAIEGLMCIPPADENPGPHFALLAKLARENGVDRVSMGMSGDFEIATAMGATSVRVGSAIFGSR